MMKSQYLRRNYTILVLPRLYGSDVYQGGKTPGTRRFRCTQADQPNALLLFKDKESAKSSQFTAHQCWLVMALPTGRGGGGDCTTTPPCLAALLFSPSAFEGLPRLLNSSSLFPLPIHSHGCPEKTPFHYSEVCLLGLLPVASKPSFFLQSPQEVTC